MSVRISFLVMAVLALATSFAIGGQRESSVEDFAWLAGHWRGEGLGGECEEVWSAPMAGTMMGTFRLVKDGDVQFYEILVLTRDGDGIVMKVKHFSREFVAWEAKEDAVAFELEHVEPNHARFKGLTLTRNGDELDVSLSMRRKDGTVEQEAFRFRRYQP